jgi:hypothetical protein
MVEADSWTPEAYDQYLTALVLLPRGDSQERAVLKRRTKDDDGNPVGKRDANPILDTREYEVEFPDGSIDVYTANTLAEAMYSQVDDEGRHVLMLKEIVDHSKDRSAVHIDDGFVSGSQQRRWTTKGWKLVVEWKDGTTTWVPLKELKDSNPISKVRSRYLVRTHKFGIEVPKSWKRALEIDVETGTIFWRKAIKMDFTRKARFVADGHLTDPPKESVYSSVVTRESVRIFFLICALNGLDVLACDVQNAYLNATTKEFNWFVAGPELGSDNVGKSVLIVRALYGLRSSGAQWREHLAKK